MRKARALADGLPGGECTLVVIAHYAAQQTVVAGRNAVMVVQGDTSEGRYEYAVFLVVAIISAL